LLVISSRTLSFTKSWRLWFSSQLKRTSETLSALRLPLISEDDLSQRSISLSSHSMDTNRNASWPLSTWSTPYLSVSFLFSWETRISSRRSSQGFACSAPRRVIR
jgi:hypothetical protein